MDARNPAASESAGSVWSLVVVPGSDLMDARDVAYGTWTKWRDYLIEFAPMLFR